MVEDTVNFPTSACRALITGVAGSCGTYLVDYLAEQHPEVELHGLVRWRSAFPSRGRSYVGSRVHVYEADLLDFGSLLRALDLVQPHVVVHIASHAHVASSFATPSVVLSNNILGTSNLFEAVRHTHQDPVILLCSTSEVYGQVEPVQSVITEKTPLCPINPYAVSKAAQDLLGGSYWASYGMRIVRARMFSYINPRRSDLFASTFAQQIVRIERGQQSVLTHGFLDSIRTLIDVRDAVRAYWDIARQGVPGEVYNIGGTTPISVRHVLQRLIDVSGVSVDMRMDPTLLRPVDILYQVPDVSKFVSVTGWNPRYTLHESLTNVLSYYRSRQDDDVI